jgi:NADH dehydrogenase
VVVLGGGFGGVTATRQLERLCAGRPDVELTLVSRDNFFVLSPLLFEACSGTLELRHCAQPIRPALRRARFVEGTVVGADLDRRVVHVGAADDATLELPYDQLVVALGATTNVALIPGSDAAHWCCEITSSNGSSAPTLRGTAGAGNHASRSSWSAAGSSASSCSVS